MLKLTTDNHEASRSISATAELLVIARQDFSTKPTTSVCKSTGRERGNQKQMKGGHH